MGFFNNFKQKFENFSDRAFIGSSPIHPIIKENRQMLEAELKLSLESREGIQALQDYAEIETPASKEALNQVSIALNKVESNRRRMVEQLRTGFVRPFEVLSELWKELEILKKELGRAEKNVKHAENNLQKKQDKQEKDPAKMKENEMELAEQALDNAKTELESAQETLKLKEKDFHEKKLEVIRNSIDVLIKERKIFHNGAKNLLGKVKSTVTDIKIRTEGKIYAEQVEKSTGNTQADSENQAEEKEKEKKKEKEEATFKSKLLNFTERITKTDLELRKVIKENKQILETHAKLMKETTEAITIYKNYAEQESPDIQGIFNRFAGALETIETNRQAFIEQMKFEFIEPLEKLAEEYKALQTVIKETEGLDDKLEKARKKLAKLQSKPEEKLKPEDIPEAEKNLKEAEAQSESAHQKMQAKSVEFGTLKAKTIKDSLISLIERNFKFHDQASNIIQNAEILG